MSFTDFPECISVVVSFSAIVSQDQDDIVFTLEKHFAALWPTLPNSPLHFLTALTVLVGSLGCPSHLWGLFKRLHPEGSLFSHLFTFLAF